ncbi:MAG: CHASE2 domain-containing protein [Candidatus Tantalella remota]|nr:CHASE2 domain-containing protein [Candidatus Tantalella remota]
MIKSIDKEKILFYILAVLVSLVMLFLSFSRVFDEFEYSTLDFRYKIRPAQPVDEKIVIIEVGDDSIDKIGKWPFPRNYHALLTKALKSAGVETIVFDIFFSETNEGDEAFADAVKEAGNVYIPYVFELDRDNPDKSKLYATGYAAPLIKPLADAALGTGFVNVKPDQDGKVRRIPPFIEYEGKYYPNLTVLIALNNLDYSFDNVKIIPGKKMIVDDDLVIPLGYESSMLVDYPDVWGSAFKHYSYVDVLQSYLADVTGQKPVINLKNLKGTVCFIGLTATASPDAHPSPMEPLYPGIGVHTSVYNSILENEFIFRLNKWWNLLLIIVVWFITAYSTVHSRKRFAFLSIVTVMLFYVILAISFFWNLGIWVDVFYPLLSIGIIYAIFTFKKYVTELRKREVIEKELYIAKDIQQSFLPTEIPDVGGLEVSVKMVTALHVGGDLYDIVKLDDNRLGVMLGDVSGKGVPAALYMAKVVSVFKTFVKEGSPTEVLKMVNDRLCADSSSGLFVTLTFMDIEPGINKIKQAIGGHMPTMVIAPDGTVQFLDVTEGMPLGMIECDFAPGEHEYQKGSIFVLYSDGVTEAMNTRGEMFEEERLSALGTTLAGCSAEEVVDAIHMEVTAFAGKAKQHDDITVMAIKT